MWDIAFHEGTLYPGSMALLWFFADRLSQSPLPWGVFEAYSEFAESRFEGSVYFDAAQFKGDSFFRRTVFNKRADFGNAVFHKGADFTKVFFGGDYNVESATFYSPSRTRTFSPWILDHCCLDRCCCVCDSHGPCLDKIGFLNKGL